MAVPLNKNSRLNPEKLPVKLMNDRILVHIENSEGERRSIGGIVIPATAQVARRLIWAKVVSTGPNVRNVSASDRVLFEPEDRYEVEIQGQEYILLRERDIHAVSSTEDDTQSTGLYL
jgi:chaperonin GroES